MHTWISRILITTILLFSSAQAFALDGYRDRRGLYYGLGFGGAQTKTDVGGAKGQLGYNLRFRVGGGINKTLTLDTELGIHSAEYTQNGSDIQVRSAPSALVFIRQRWLYVRLVFGMSEFEEKSAIPLGVRRDCSSAGAAMSFLPMRI